MEPPQHLQLDELEKNAATDDMDNCRLRHGLNTHCQIKVIQYLTLKDLLKLCETDSYFEDIIMNWVIGRRLINLEMLYPDGNLEMFEAFGKSFRKLRVKGNEYNFILETIIKYCSPNTLTELQIIVKAPLNQEKMDVPMNLFTKLEKLRLECHHDSELFLEHLEKIAGIALNLKILQVRGNRIQGEWLKTKHMQNLRELWLHTTQNMSIDDLTSFLRERPKLKVFSFTGRDDIATIGKSLSKYCSGLEKFCYVDLAENENYNYIQADPTNRFDFLSTFLNLNTWTLTSFSAYPYFLKTLLASNDIKELIIRTDLCSYKNQCKIKHIASLKTMKVEISVNGGDDTKEQYELNCDFIASILSQVKNKIDNMTLISERKLTNFNKILDSLPSVRTLSISNIAFKYLPLEIRKIVRTVRKIERNGENDQHLLKLIVNENQWRELTFYEDIEGFVSISIDLNPMLNI